MKTKAQKKSELDKSQGLLLKSQTLLFADLSRVGTPELRRLREEIKSIGGNLVVIKKRLLNLLFKDKGINYDTKKSKLPLATIFSEADLEKTSGVLFKFFSGLEVAEGQPKDAWHGHIAGGYDLKEKAVLSPDEVRVLGKLPPREAVLGQLLGLLTAPVRSLMYLLNQKGTQENKT